MPMPGVPTESLPGSALASAISSRRVVRRQTTDCANSSSGEVATRAIGAKSGDHVERHVLVQPLVQNGGAFHQQQRVTVGRGLGDAVGADHAAARRAVLDHDRLLEPLLRASRRSAGRWHRRRRPAPIGTTMVIWPLRIELRRCGRRDQGQQRCGKRRTRDTPFSPPRTGFLSRQRSPPASRRQTSRLSPSAKAANSAANSGSAP